MESNNKRIAKNTALLYVRMMLIMFVTLFTSRVVLQVLGVSDFGTYQAVGGVVGLMSFINGALSTGSSRFLTFELGTGDSEKLKKTFSTVFTAHIALAVFVVLIGETVGLWFVYNKLVIPESRLDAALYTYHLSIITCFFTISQVPYNASIISHEKMNIYAYMSIIDVVLKLIFVYSLYISPWDKLVVYSTGLALITVGMMVFYRVYCIRHIQECRYKFILDKEILRNVLGYSGWNLFANTSLALTQQGTTILINMFFAPSVVAARAIANQVNGVANQFINNFRTAVNPQIVKRYAAQDYDGSKKLLLNSTKYSYYLMLVLALPIFMVAEQLLQLWLGQVPPYSVPFLQLIIVTSLFQVFDTSFYTALYAKGKIRENAMISPTLVFLCFPIIYIFFKLGFSPMSCAWVMLINYILLGLVVKPILIIKIVDYNVKDILSVFIPCLKVTIISVPIPIILYCNRSQIFSNSLLQFFTLASMSVICVAVTVWFFGIDKALRMKCIDFIKRGKK